MTGDNLQPFVTGLSGAPLLETRIDFARAVESWERAGQIMGFWHVN